MDKGVAPTTGGQGDNIILEEESAPPLQPGLSRSASWKAKADAAQRRKSTESSGAMQPPPLQRSASWKEAEEAAQSRSRKVSASLAFANKKGATLKKKVAINSAQSKGVTVTEEAPPLQLGLSRSVSWKAKADAAQRRKSAESSGAMGSAATLGSAPPMQPGLEKSISWKAKADAAQRRKKQGAASGNVTAAASTFNKASQKDVGADTAANLRAAKFERNAAKFGGNRSSHRGVYKVRSGTAERVTYPPVAKALGEAPPRQPGLQRSTSWKAKASAAQRRKSAEQGTLAAGVGAVAAAAKMFNKVSQKQNDAAARDKLGIRGGNFERRAAKFGGSKAAKGASDHAANAASEIGSGIISNRAAAFRNTAAEEQSVVQSGRACSNFTLDMAAAFGMCTCGFAKAAHKAA
jgi:hypothetical protein